MKQTGSQLLTDWMRRRQLTGREAAVILRVHYSLVSKFANGKRRPPLETAVNIEKRTGIPVESWVSRRRPKLSEQVSADAA